MEKRLTFERLRNRCEENAARHGGTKPGSVNALLTPFWRQRHAIEQRRKARQ